MTLQEIEAAFVRNMMTAESDRDRVDFSSTSLAIAKQWYEMYALQVGVQALQDLD